MIASFLEVHLEQYGDKIDDIEKAIDYIFNGNGGVLVVQKQQDQVVGATVINKTGMHGYIPENILVYIAIHKDFRGLGLGRKLMEKALNHVDGDVALHVERDNPAIKLYESIGFTNPYLEMRLKRCQ
ncbi:GNAT family N-acetyltransferase [Halosquirtibacter xylanolyticus]|nr:GNAT family N-acetyltransferase [Prolixibacteraceae bacterium]